MAHSYLIIGGQPETRRQKSQEIITQLQGTKISNLDNQPDILWLSEPESIKINQVREIKKKVQLKPYQLKYKFIVLEDAEKLTLAAQNALLKTLEEPPKKSIIILLATNPEAFLATIISRVQIIRLSAGQESQISAAELQETLQRIKMILKANPGQRLKLAEKVTTTKDSSLLFTKTQLFSWRELLINKTTVEKTPPWFPDISLNQIIITLKNIQKIHRLIKNQVNHRLAVENLLLAYPKL